MADRPSSRPPASVAITAKYGPSEFTVIAVSKPWGDWEPAWAPADQHPSAGQHLHAALEGGEQARPRVDVAALHVAALQRGPHGAGVQVDQDAPGLRLLRRGAAVVEDAQRVRALRQGVVLEPERRARPHLEAGPLPAELPDDLPAGPGHLVDRAGVAAGQDQGTVRRDRDRVDMEVVEWMRRGPPGERHDGVGDRDVVDAAPGPGRPARPFCRVVAEMQLQFTERAPPVAGARSAGSRRGASLEG